MPDFKFGLSRRSFLKDAAISMALLAGGTSLFNPMRYALADVKAAGKETWLICDTPKYVGASFMKTHQVMLTNPGSVVGLDVQSGLAFSIDTPFFGHTVTQNPAHPHQIITFEKWGRRGALLDLKERKLVSMIESGEGQVFFGHAVFPSGTLNFITSEDNYDHKNGQLIVRDSSSLKPVGQISSYGNRPHECIMTDNGRTIIVANACGTKSIEYRSNVAWIEAASGKLLHQVVVGDEPRAVYSHLALSPDGWVCAIGFMQPEEISGSGRIRLISPEGKAIAPEIPDNIAAHLTGEVLSVTFLGDSGLVAATAPKSSKVIVLDYRKQKYVDVIDVPRASGILFDTSLPASACGMIVNNSKDKNVEEIMIPPSGATPTVTVNKSTFGGNGVHLSRIYI